MAQIGKLLFLDAGVPTRLSSSVTTGLLEGNATFQGDFAVKNDAGSTTQFSVDSESGLATFAGSAVVQGNLIINGSTTSVNSQDILLADRFTTQNYTYTTPQNVGITSGATFIVKPLTAEFSISAATTATLRFTTTTDSSAVLTAGKIIAVRGMTNPANNGLFVVADSGVNYIEIDTAPGSDLAGVVNTTIVDESGASGVTANVVIAVLRADSTGASFSTGFGSTKTGITFDEISGADSITLQQAYANTNGNKIQTTTGRNIIFDLDNSAAFEVDGAGAVRFGKIAGEDNEAISSFYVEASGAFDLKGGSASSLTVDANDLTLQTTTSGALAVSSAGVLDLDAAGAITIESSASTISIGADNVAQNISVGTAGARTISIGSGSATAINLQSALNTLTAAQNDVVGKLSVTEASGTEVKNYGLTQIDAGTILCVGGGTRGVKAALADDAVGPSENRVFGVAVDNLAASGASFGFAASAPGCFVTINLDGSLSGTAGDPVYLSAANAGLGVLLAPSNAGNSIVQVGYLAATIVSASTAEIVFSPQFIAAIPA